MRESRTGSDVTGTPVVIYNPAAGRGVVARHIAGLSARLPVKAEWAATTGPGDAATIAEDAVRRGVTWILAAGGDGTVHETANGILNAGNPDVTFVPLPLGSMNDYAFSLGILDWWSAHRHWDRLETMLVDVGVIQGGGRRAWFVNCCGIGFNGMVTIEARKIRWLRGIPLYALAVVKALFRHFHTPAMNIVSDGEVREQRTLAYTLGLGQREGGFPLTAMAKLDDGLFDALHVGKIHRWELLRHLPGMISGWLPRKHPKLTFQQTANVAVDTVSPLCIHCDGEFFCRPEDGVTRVTIQLIPRRLRVAFDPASIYGGTCFDKLRRYIERSNR